MYLKYYFFKEFSPEIDVIFKLNSDFIKDLYKEATEIETEFNYYMEDEN